MKKWQIISLCLYLIFFLPACSYLATSNAYFYETSRLVYEGKLQDAINRIIDGKDSVYKAKDRLMFYLDLGMLYHYQGDYHKSNEYLSRAELAFEELYTKSISKAAFSLLLNDNTMEYSGEDYEDIYLNIFKALNYLALNQTQEAFVEVRRVNEKLRFLEDRYYELAASYNQSKDAAIKLKTTPNRFIDSALASYISLLLYRQDNRWDDVRIDHNKINQAFARQPEIYDFAKPDLSSSVSPQGNCRLNLLCFSGKSPQKRSRSWWIRTFKEHVYIGHSRESLLGDNVSNYIDSFYWPGAADNLFFKFSFPVMQSQPSRVHKVAVVIDDSIWHTQLIENLDNAALATFELKKNLIYTKSIIRTVAKGLLAQQGKNEMASNLDNELVSSLFNLGADLALAASEQADLRISHYFPKMAHIAEIHLPPGEHLIKINYYDQNNFLFFTDIKNVNLQEHKLNLLESYCLQ